MADFGTGLALTTFTIANLTGGLAFDVAAPDAPAAVSVNVTNTGAVAGDTVAFLYSWPSAPAAAAAAAPLPLRRLLLDYARVHLAPGESTIVTFSVAARALAVVDRVTADTVLAPGAGELELTLGDARTAPIRLPVAITGASPSILERFPVF